MPMPPLGKDPSFFGINPSERIVNYPLRVHMLGWESNTRLLQRAGWELSVKQDMQFNFIQLAMQHRERKLVALSRHYAEFNFMRLAHDQPSAYRFFDSFFFEIEYLASKMEIVISEASIAGAMRTANRYYEGFYPIDAEPQYEILQRKKLEDFVHFRPINNAKNIIVDPNDVPQLMELILKAQSPVQAEIRKRQRQAENMAYVIDAGLLPRHDIHAQIITVAA